MSKIITLRKGLDINLRGKAQESLADAPQASEYALSPLDFEGVTPKLLVKVGDEVKAGTPLFFNKYSERVLFTSPVSGTVAAVNRGEKRKVLSVTVTPDATQSYEEFAKPDLQNQNIHLLFIKIMKRRTGCNFKKCRNRLAFCRQLFAELPHQGDFLCKIIIRNFRTIEEIAFIVSLQMGGGICADAIARLL